MFNVHCKSGDAVVDKTTSESRLQHLIEKVYSEDLATNINFQQIEKIESRLKVLLESISKDASKWALIRTGTSANCNLTKHRNRVDFTLLVKTQNVKTYLEWVKKQVIDPYPGEFSEVQVVSETRYLFLSFVHNPTQMVVSLNVNNIAGIFNCLLISHFNSVDLRVHRLSIFMLRWHQ